MLRLLVCVLLVGNVVPATVPKYGEEQPVIGSIFLNRWAVKIQGGEDTVRMVVEPHGFEYVTSIFGDWHTLRANGQPERFSTGQGDVVTELAADVRVLKLQQQRVSQRFPKDLEIQDERFPEQWYMYSEDSQDINVMEAWQQCASGNGVNIAFVDDGLALDNQDIAPNLKSDLNLDAYTNGKLASAIKSSHGTKCAGIAAAANNQFCGLGVAYDAGISGIRVLGGDFTDEVEGRGLAYKQKKIDIYSCSYGPPDDGKWLEPLGELAAEAIQNGATKGRNGKGNIYVYSTGNGGASKDSCAYDPYIQSPYTIGVGGVKQSLKKLDVGEFCTSTMVVSYTQDSGSSKHKFVTTDFGSDGCVDKFSGTSASTAQVSGAIANALQANPNLSNRDVQHLLALTSNTNLGFNPSDFVKNAAGYKVSGHFGFGLLDAGKLVEYAKRWRSVPQVHECTITIDGKINIPDRLIFEVNEKHCGSGIGYLEHVSLYIDAKYCSRGNMGATLKSPEGTETLILPGRPADSRESNIEWTAMSHAFWAENPYPRGSGKWTLDIFSLDGNKRCSGKIFETKLILRGMAKNPADLLEKSPLPGIPNEACDVLITGPGKTTQAPKTTKPTPSATDIPPTNPPEGCTSEYRQYRQVSFRAAGTSSQGKVSSPDECQKKCDRDKKCVSFSYNTMRGGCTTHTKNLWDSSISLDVSEHDDYYEIICYEFDAEECSDRYLSQGMHTYLYAPKRELEVMGKGVSKSKCEEICSQTPGCRAVNWDSYDEICEVSYRSPKTASVLPRMGYYVQYKLCGEAVRGCKGGWDRKNLSTFLYHPALPAVLYPTNNPDSCEAACQDDNHCMGYNFLYEGFKCELLYFTEASGGQMIGCSGQCVHRKKLC